MSAAPFDRWLFVVGMRAEARLVGGRWPAAVGPQGLEAAVRDARPDALISFGLCGGLDPSLAAGDLVLATAVSDGSARFETAPALLGRLAEAAPLARTGAVLGSEQIIAGADGKARAAAATGALAVDMESHVVARTARRLGAPFAVLRAVSDAATDNLPASAAAGFRRDGSIDLRAVLWSLARRPSDLPALIRTGAHTARAMRALHGCLVLLASGTHAATVRSGRS